MKKSSSVCIGLALPCALAMAADNPAGKDADFVKKAAQGGIAEVSMGQIAAQKGSDPSIKEFGQRMASEHQQANDELKQIAQRENLAVPGEPSKAEQKSADKLEQLQGSHFDDTYARMMVKDHEEDVALFKKEAQSGADPDLKAYAQKTLPTLEEHLRMAKQLPRHGNKSG